MYSTVVLIIVVFFAGGLFSHCYFILEKTQKTAIFIFCNNSTINSNACFFAHTIAFGTGKKIIYY